MRLVVPVVLALVALSLSGCGSPSTAGYQDVLGDAKQCRLTIYADEHDTIWDARVHSGDT